MRYEPYALAMPTTTFTLASPDFTDGGELPRTCYATDANRSPARQWSDLPEGTESVAVTAFDADAPLPGGL